VFNSAQSTRYHRTIQSLTLPITLFFLYIGINYLPQRSLSAADYTENLSLWDKTATIREFARPNGARTELHTPADYCADSEGSSEVVDSTLPCIWGYVYYQGRPIEGAKVVLKLGQREIETVTQTYADELEPYYQIRLPSPIEEPLHITASFARQSVEQSFQHINTISTLENGFSLGIASKGRWKLWYLNLHKVNRLAITQDEKRLLAGSSEGFTEIAYDPSSQRILSQLNYKLFNEAEIRDLAIDPWGDVWIVTENRIAIWQGSHWLFMDDPILEGIEWETLISHPDTGDMWFGGRHGASTQDNSTIGEVVVYDRDMDSWSHYASLDGSVTTFAIDTQKHVWIGTWGDGLYEYDPDQGWIHHFAGGGLPSNYIHVVYAQPRLFIPDRRGLFAQIHQAIWVGTAAENADSLGGIGRYDPSQKVWKSYTINHGLPSQQSDAIADSKAQEVSSEKTAAIYDILIDSRDGLVWAGTQEGLYIFSNETEGQERWSLHDPSLQGEVRALAFIQESLIIATSTNLQRLISPVSNSQSPPIQFPPIQSPSISIVPYRRNGQIELNGSSFDDQSSETLNQNIITWYWVSDLDGLFCTEALTCLVTDLSPGLHKITLQRQDSYGKWLPSATTQLQLGYTTYLPIYK